MKGIILKWHSLLLCIIPALGLYSNLSFAGGDKLQLGGPDGYVAIKWQDIQMPVKWYLSEDGLPGSGINNTDLANILQTAFTTWSDVPTSRISFQYMGETPERTGGVDGKSLITFTDQDYVFQEGETAVTLTYAFLDGMTIDDTNNDLNNDGFPDIPNGTYPAGSIYESDILFNASYNFVDKSINSTDPTEVDIRSVALHEIGHFIGLSHSVISDAVMNPFLSLDLSSSRTLKADDIAYASSIYPDTSYATTFGSVSGNISNGVDGTPILGAHVFAVDPLTGIKTVGAYSLLQGDYTIPGLTPGSYYIGIEPLDSNPPEADPKRIYNQVIADTFDTNFTPEFYDANESGIETDPNNALAVDVTAGNDTSGIDIATNATNVPGVSVTLQPGINLFSYPVNTSAGFTVFDLLSAIGDASEINSIDRYNTTTGRYERAQWVNGQPEGIDFDIQRGEAYLVHMNIKKTVTFLGHQDCPAVNTVKGFNLVGVSCPPSGYKAYDLLNSIGAGVISVQRYNHDNQSLDTASLGSDGNPTGTDFAIINGEGYVVNMLGGKSGVSPSGAQNIFPPYISGLSPGRGIVGSEVTIIGQGFSDDPAKNQVTFNGVQASVSYASGGKLIVNVPNGASSGPIVVSTAGKTSNSVNFTVESTVVSESELQGKDMIDGQSVQGNLDTNDEQDRYSFIVTKGSSISAAAVSVTGVPDIWLYLEGPSGEVLTKDENSSDGPNAAISRFTAGRTGRYTLVVAARPGSGSGAYTLSLNIENVPAVSEIAILSGDAQTGLMGTQLAAPLEVLVTSSSGQPVSGVYVNIVTNDSDNIGVNNSSSAATYPVLTNSSGIVTINMTLPNTTGVYDITINVPGYNPVVIKASSVASLPVKVVIDGNHQDCGGAGCPVGQPLPTPYTLRFLDSSDQPVVGVLTKFTVVSGGGKLVASPKDVDEINMASNANGDVFVTHRLGTVVMDPKTGIRIPQIVAATATNPGSELLLFESIATAGPATKIQSLKTSAVRMTMGTAVLNAIQVKVVDSYGNPVANTPVSYSAEGGLMLLPCESCSGGTNDYVTSSEGVFIGTLVADYQYEDRQIISIYSGAAYTPGGTDGTWVVGVSGVTPTIDETGARITIGSAIKKAPYQLQISSGGASKNIDVDVDMGPALVFNTASSTDNNAFAAPGTSQWVGKYLDKAVATKVVAYTRFDSCSWEEVGTNFAETDGGYIGDEPYDNIYLLVPTSYDGERTWVVKRSDGNNDGAQIDVIDNSKDANIKMGSAAGEVLVEARIPANYYTVPQFSVAGICITSYSGLPYYYDSLPLRDQWIALMNEYPPIVVKLGGLVLDGFFNAVSPKIIVTVNDDSASGSTSDPLQIIRSNSGVDLTRLVINLNDVSVFDGSSGNVLQMGQYPHYMEAYVDGAILKQIDNIVLQSFSPEQFKFIYYPTASEFKPTSPNTIDVTNIVDRLGNSGSDVQQIFTLP